jgi:hypothetical protein
VAAENEGEEEGGGPLLADISATDGTAGGARKNALKLSLVDDAALEANGASALAEEAMQRGRQTEQSG